MCAVSSRRRRGKGERGGVKEKENQAHVVQFVLNPAFPFYFPSTTNSNQQRQEETPLLQDLEYGIELSRLLKDLLSSIRACASVGYSPPKPHWTTSRMCPKCITILARKRASREVAIQSFSAFQCCLTKSFCECVNWRALKRFTDSLTPRCIL